ncbi:MAG: glycosyltransferase family A protein [Chthoniobacteraceae bacterium]
MSHPAPLCTAIVRCHNSESTVERALQSLIAQDLGERLEIIAVDDGSTDGSWSRIEKFAHRVRTFRLTPNRGNIAAAYAGLAQARGEYFFLLDADDHADANMASLLTTALAAEPAAAFAYCDYAEHDELGRHRVISIGGYVREMIACNALFRREIVAREGYWDAAFLLPEYDLVIRLLLKYDAVYVPQAPYHYCRHTASLTRQDGFFERAMHQLDERFGQLSASGKFHGLTVTECRHAGATLTYK